MPDKRRVLGQNVPAAGVGYFRVLPLVVLNRALAQAVAHERHAVFYFHPREFDPDTPRMPFSRIGWFRTYVGLRRTLDRLRRILTQAGPWRPIGHDLDALRAMADKSDPFMLRGLERPPSAPPYQVRREAG